MSSLLNVAKKHGKPHQLLVQLLMKLSGIKMDKIVEVFQAICEADSIPIEPSDQYTPGKLCKELRKTINPVLLPLGLEIGMASDQRFPDERFLVMYATSSGAKFSKLFTEDEYRLFVKWFNLMFVNSENRGELDATEALNSATTINVSMTTAQTFLNKLEADQLFHKLAKFDSYVFTLRAIMELEPRLRSYDVPSCPICSHLVVVKRFSHHCFICNTVLHNHCLYKMIKLSDSRGAACPGTRNDGIKCTMKFDEETLEELIFDSPIPAVINPPEEIIGHGVENSDLDIAHAIKNEELSDVSEHSNSGEENEALENDDDNVESEIDENQKIEANSNGSPVHDNLGESSSNSTTKKRGMKKVPRAASNIPSEERDMVPGSSRVTYPDNVDETMESLTGDEAYDLRDFSDNEEI